MKIDPATRRWLPLPARAAVGDRRGHVPAHALPRAERPKVDKIANCRKPQRHAVHGRVRAATALGGRPSPRRKYASGLFREQEPRIPEGR